MARTAFITVKVGRARMEPLRELVTARGWPANTPTAAIVEGGLQALEQLYSGGVQARIDEATMAVYVVVRTSAAHQFAESFEALTGQRLTAVVSEDAVRVTFWANGEEVLRWGEEMPDPAADAERMAARLDEHASVEEVEEGERP